MNIAITGTPGTGKTTLARLLKGQGARVISLLEWAQKHDAVGGHDDEDDADIIDVDALADVPLPGCYLDGHLAHLLPVDVIWLIRCDPTTLGQRLQERGYGPAKVHENWEAEAMDLVLQEALATGRPVIQRDGTRRSPEELLAAFQRVEPHVHDLEHVDWTARLLD